MHDVIIIGAGMAGLAAARDLSAAGADVVVVDKGRSVGGRLSTRRVDDARLDHGAQFFTVRTEPFAQLVADAMDAGAVRIWNHGFTDSPDGHPRHTGDEGMTTLAKWMAEDVDVRTSMRISHLASTGAGWELRADDDRTLQARSIIATAPVPQTLALIDDSGLTLPSAQDEALRAIRYHPVLALLVTIDGPGAVHPSGGEQHDDGLFSFVGDNHSKGISASPALTFHANHSYSAAHFEDPDEPSHANLLEQAAPWFGSSSVISSQLKRWRYAGPVDVHPDATMVAHVEGAPVAFAGDAFAGPKVEGAFSSGRAAAAELSRLL